MAEEGGEGGGGGDDHGASGAAGAAPKLKLDTQTLLLLANAILLLAALGMFVYTKLLFHRPVIAEETEIQKKQEELKKPAEPTDRPIIVFEQMIVNIAMTSGKAHYITIAFAVECKDDEIAATVKAKKALFIDQLIALVGKRQLTELNTIQGKLLLKTELMRKFDAIVNPGGITNIYFSNFILQ